MSFAARTRTYFVGRYLDANTDVFEQARVLMFYRFLLLFSVLFLLPLLGDYALDLKKGLIKHCIDMGMIAVLLFIILRRAPGIDVVINLFFSYTIITCQVAFMIFNPMVLDPISVAWAILFFSLSVMLQKGAWRLLYCLFLGWVPILYVLLNTRLKGALTVDFLREKDLAGPPDVMGLLPIVLTIAGVWGYASTIQHARRIMTTQKKVIEEKNKDITDSIHYAKRIQLTLLPSEKYIERILNECKRAGGQSAGR